jgi:SNF2-related domain
LSPSSECGSGSSRRAATPFSDGEDCDKASQELYRANASSLSRASVSVVRAPVLSILTCPGTVRQAFKPPAGARRTEDSDVLLKRKSLGIRRALCMIQPGKFRAPVQEEEADCDVDITGDTEDAAEAAKPEPAADPAAPPVEPLILWQSDDGSDPPHTITVDPRLCKFLRPHQREGVQFMFECLMGLREVQGEGCILADDMGLGKTLQSIAVLWTLLKQGREKGKPAARRAVVVCPTSLVTNWESELEKWLKGECKCIALSEASRDQVISSITLFLNSPVYKVIPIATCTYCGSSCYADARQRVLHCGMLCSLLQSPLDTLDTAILVVNKLATMKDLQQLPVIVCINVVTHVYQQ